MKRSLQVLLSFALIFALVACTNTESSTPVSTDSSGSSSAASTPAPADTSTPQLIELTYITAESSQTVTVSAEAEIQTILGYIDALSPDPQDHAPGEITAIEVTLKSRNENAASYTFKPDGSVKTPADTNASWHIAPDGAYQSLLDFFDLPVEPPTVEVPTTGR